jgi:hypothetical protein
VTDSEFDLPDDFERRLHRLRAAIAEGEKGEGVPWTPKLMEQLWREADEMRRRGEKADPDVCP